MAIVQGIILDPELKPEENFILVSLGGWRGIVPNVATVLPFSVNPQEVAKIADYVTFLEDDASGRILPDAAKELIKTLKPSEADVITKRFNLDGNGYRTLDEIGRERGITREVVRVKEARALSKLRHVPRRSVLEGFIYRPTHEEIRATMARLERAHKLTSY